MKLFAGIIAVLIGLAAIVRCSLVPPPRSILFRMQAQSSSSRSGPAISQFQYYALAVSGNVGSSIAPNALENRSVSCLYLNGNVTFPLTYSQLTSTGIPLTLATGNYRFSVLGIHGAAVNNAVAVPQIFVPGSPPQLYLLAQGTLDAKEGQASLAATYDSNTPNRVAACPLPSANQFTLSQSYVGLSGAANNSAILYSLGEGTVPPTDFFGYMPSISDPFQLQKFTPSQSSGHHLRLDLTFDPPSNLAALVGIRISAHAAAGYSVYGGGHCLFSGLAGATFKLALWRNDINSWANNTAVDGDDGFQLEVTNTPAAPILLNGKLLVSLRSNAFGTSTQCINLQLNSANVVGL